MNMRNAIKTGVLILAMGCLCACGSDYEMPDVVVDSEEEVISYSLVTAQVDDVVLTKSIDCIFEQTNAQEVSFDSTGKYVDKVYVREGQEVKKGDLLCELSSGALEEDIERLDYQVRRNELLLGYTDMDESLEIQDLYIAGIADADSVGSVEERYDRQRQLLGDSLEFDRQELAEKRKELKASRVYAQMDGKVYKLKSRLEGSTTREAEVIMTIVDNSSALFTVQGVDDRDLFREGEPVNMKVSYSTASGDYILLPYEMDQWTDKMSFSIYTGPDGMTPEVGARGTITIPVESRKQVLSIPLDVLHIAGDKAFVYTLSPENNREIRYVEIGLKGDERVEILSGLTEGEKVVKK